MSAVRAMDTLNRATPMPAWCQLQRGFATHHKTGTMLARYVVSKLRQNDQALEECRWPELVIGHVNPGAVHSVWRNDFWQEVPCIAHFVRNPFEIIVSGYLYHLNKEEPWTTRPLLPENKSVWHAHAKRPNWQGGLTMHTFAALSTAQLRQYGVLPSDFPIENLRAGESYASYLERVSPTVGLAVEAMRAMQHDFPQMEQKFLDLQGDDQQGCRANYCLEHFMTTTSACLSLWREVLRKLAFPRHWLLSSLSRIKG
eukprot:818988-Amphidinium_carterae.1